MASFLLEYYPPFLQLISSENNKKRLMSFGLGKESKLIKISKTEAKDNKEDLLLFRNTFPQVIKTVTVKLKGKAQEEDRGVWIGWKKGNEFEVIKPNEAGGKELTHLLNADFVYAVKTPSSKKGELKKQYKAEHPSSEEDAKPSTKMGFKLYWSKFNSQLKNVLDLYPRVVIKQYEEQFETPFLKNEGWQSVFSTPDYEVKSMINNIQSYKAYLQDDEDKNKPFDKKKYDTWYANIEKEITEYKKQEGIK